MYETDVRWKPRHPRTLLVSPLDSSGMKGGIEVQEDSRRNKMQGYVLTTKDCVEIEPGDIVMYEEGMAELLKTATGEELSWITEDNVTAIDDDLWPKPKPETQLASGLYLPSVS